MGSVVTAPTPATPLCMAPACSRPAMHDGECGPAPTAGWDFQPDSRDTASTLLPPTPDAPVEVGAGAFIESVPTPAEVAAVAVRACCCRTNCPCEVSASHVHRCLDAALDIGHCDSTCTGPCPARRSDATTEGDPR